MDGRTTPRPSSQGKVVWRREPRVSETNNLNFDFRQPQLPQWLLANS